MSYEIVRHQFVATAKHVETPPSAEDPRGRATSYQLCIVFWSSNNVEPRTYDGQLLAWSGDSSSFYFANGQPVTPHQWAGDATLPRTIWECGHSCDGGSIKQYPSKHLPGTAWMRQWKNLAARPIDIAPEGRLLVPPTVSMWAQKDSFDHYRAGEYPSFPSYHEESLRAAWDLVFGQIFSNPAIRHLGQNVRTTISTTAELAAALSLKDALKESGISLYISWTERDAARFQNLLSATPAPPAKPAPTTFKSGDILEIYGKRYRLLSPIKKSWTAARTTDEKMFKISPKYLAEATLIPPTPKPEATPQPTAPPASALSLF